MLCTNVRTWIVLHTPHGRPCFLVALPVLVQLDLIKLAEFVRWRLTTRWIISHGTECSAFFFISLPVVVKVPAIQWTEVMRLGRAV